MDPSLNLYLKWQRDLERMTDPLGLSKLRDRLDLHGLGARPSELAASFDRLGLVKPPDHDLLGRLDSALRLEGTFSFAQRFDAHRGLFADYDKATRAYGSARALGGVFDDVSKLAGSSLHDLQDKLRHANSSSLTKLIESSVRLESRLALTAPRAHTRWFEDMGRSVAPWLRMHEALWPHDALVLRMLDTDNANAVGAASWLVDGDEEPCFELAALTHEEAAGRPIEIEYDIRCQLCGAAIYDAGSKSEWVGPLLEIRIDVLPICWDCTARDQREPGYLLAALLAYAEKPPRERPQLVHTDPTIEPSAPAGIGKLTLLRDPDPEDDE